MKIKTSLSVVIRIFLWMILLFGGGVFTIIHDWQTPLFKNLYFHAGTAFLGLFIIMLAFRAASNGGKELSSGRVGDIPRLETNKLVTTGIYNCMRHPMLFGLTLLPFGWALLLGSQTFITVVAPLEMLFIIFMVLVFEEREVRKKFGVLYEEYARKVPMVSFSAKCLKMLFSR
jgi:protein-S-isoprenylcysteine O-methyltransferase Ste14